MTCFCLVGKFVIKWHIGRQDLLRQLCVESSYSKVARDFFFLSLRSLEIKDAGDRVIVFKFGDEKGEQSKVT